MRRTVPPLLLLVLLAFGACGGDDSGDDKSPATTGSRQSTAQQQQSEPEGLGPALTKVHERLVEAGYRIHPPLNLPDYAAGATGVREGLLTVSIYTSRSKSDLARAKRTLARFERSQPEQTEVVIRGERIYVGNVEPPNKLDGARFQRVIKTAEG